MPPTSRIPEKREAKRREIIEAAMRVLMRDGLRACTARAVADESPLTKSAIHYYFDSTEEIVEAAMDALLAGFLGRLRTVADAHNDPTERFWAVVEDYLASFDEVPGSTVVWFAYWLDNMEAGRIERNVWLQDRIAGVLGELLADAGAHDPPARARALFSYLIGAVLRQAVHPVPFDELRPEVAALSRLDDPDAGAGQNHSVSDSAPDRGDTRAYSASTRSR
ncbi:MAG: TetR/AcrR family transcriptional regulator [Solirubrobacteraceae bacterium]